MKHEETLLPREVRLERLRQLARLGLARRVGLVSELRESVGLVSRSMIRAQHPEWCAETVERELLRRLTIR